MKSIIYFRGKEGLRSVVTTLDVDIKDGLKELLHYMTPKGREQIEYHSRDKISGAVVALVHESPKLKVELIKPKGLV